MTLSIPLQTGKAAEHLVCFDLIRQGFNAFLSDQGCGFDVIVELPDFRILRLQVRARSSAVNVGKSKEVYRFMTRSGAMSNGRLGRVRSRNEYDVLVCVALDKMKIAYLPVRKFCNKDGSIFQCIELKTLATTKGKWNKKKARVFEHYSSLKK